MENPSQENTQAPLATSRYPIRQRDAPSYLGYADDSDTSDKLNFTVDHCYSIFNGPETYQQPYPHVILPMAGSHGRRDTGFKGK